MRAFENAEALITHALERADEHVPVRDELRPTITKAEERNARDAKMRREARGEGWGDA